VIVTISILSTEGLVVSRVLEIALIAKSNALLKVIFSSYSSLKNEAAARLFAPIAVAFQPT